MNHSVVCFFFNRIDLGYKLNITLDGRPVSAYDTRVSSKIRFLCRAIDRGHGLELALQDVLDFSKDKVALFIKDGRNEQKVEWAGSGKMSVFLNYDIQNQSVIIREQCASAKALNTAWSHIGGSLYVDFKNKNLMRLEQLDSSMQVHPDLHTVLHYFKIKDKQFRSLKSHSVDLNDFNAFLEIHPLVKHTLSETLISLTSTAESKPIQLMPLDLTFDVQNVANMDVVHIRWCLNRDGKKELYFSHSYKYFVETYFKLDHEHQSIVKEYGLSFLQRFLSEPESYQLSDIRNESHSLLEDMDPIAKSFLNDQLDVLIKEQDYVFVFFNEWHLKQHVWHELKLWASFFLIESLIHGIGVSYSMMDPFVISNLKKDEFLALFAQFKMLDIMIHFDNSPVTVFDPSASIDIAEIDSSNFQLNIDLDTQDFQKLMSPDWFEGDSIAKVNDEVVVLNPEKREIWRSILKMVGQKEDSIETNVKLSQLEVLRLMGLADRLNLKLNLDNKLREFYKVLLNKSDLPSVAMPKHFQGELHPYQRLGFEWLTVIYRFGLGGCLADEMGLGKTVQIITFFAGIYEGAFDDEMGGSSIAGKDSKFLVIVPASLLYNWKQEVETFYPNFQVAIFGEEDADFKAAHVWVVSYDRFRRHIDFFMDQEFQVVVFDEAQVIKNRLSARSKAANMLNSGCKIALTGTPLENHIDEFKTILGTVVSGLFAEKDESIHSIRNKSRPFMLRRMKKDVLEDLPDLMNRDVLLTMSDDQLSLYNELALLARNKLVELNEESGETVAQIRMRVLALLTRLRQVCLSSELVLNKPQVSPKVDYLGEQVQFLLEQNESILVFSQFTSFLDIIETRFNELGFSQFRLDGSTTAIKRRNMIDQFQTSVEPQVFLLSLKAGGYGLNLTKASYVFICDPWWNPAVEEQAFSRAHRIGQKKSVIVTRLVMAKSIEEKIVELQKKKQALFNDLLTDDLSQSSFSLSDIEYVLSDI